MHCLFGTDAIISLSSAYEIILKDIGKNRPSLTTPMPNKGQTVSICFSDLQGSTPAFSTGRQLVSFRFENLNSAEVFRNAVSVSSNPCNNIWLMK